jgi:hypothetical protein
MAHDPFMIATINVVSVRPALPVASADITA